MAPPPVGMPKPRAYSPALGTAWRRRLQEGSSWTSTTNGTRRSVSKSRSPSHPFMPSCTAPAEMPRRRAHPLEERPLVVAEEEELAVGQEHDGLDGRHGVLLRPSGPQR